MGALPKPLSMTRFLGFVFFISHVSIMGIAGEMHNPKTGKLAGAEGPHAEGSVKIEGHRLVLSNISVDKVRDGRIYEMSGLEPKVCVLFQRIPSIEVCGENDFPSQRERSDPMKTHISLNVHDVKASVEFYQKVFGVGPQKQVGDYAKFDLTTPPLNFSLIGAPAAISRVNHLGIEVESANELASWEQRLQEHGLVDRIEMDADCCFARQNKVWFTDPDGNFWEVFTVLEQLPVTMPLNETGCCVPSNKSTRTTLCGCP